MVNAISAQEIAVSGLRAQRTRMNVIAINIANAETTRMEGKGGAFRRQMAIVRGESIQHAIGRKKPGVHVDKVVEDYSTPLRQVFDPSHPDANKDGYVEYPNVNMAAEMVNLIAAQRAYEANIAVLVSGRQMSQRALDILQ